VKRGDVESEIDKSDWNWEEIKHLTLSYVMLGNIFGVIKRKNSKTCV
jgi:hypothetical protein